MPAGWWRWRRSREIITAPRHPYTQMLIASLPSLERKGMMQGIPGLAPLAARSAAAAVPSIRAARMAVERCRRRTAGRCATSARRARSACHLA